MHGSSDTTSALSRSRPWTLISLADARSTCLPRVFRVRYRRCIHWNRRRHLLVAFMARASTLFFCDKAATSIPSFVAKSAGGQSCRCATYTILPHRSTLRLSLPITLCAVLWLRSTSLHNVGKLHEFPFPCHRHSSFSAALFADILISNLLRLLCVLPFDGEDEAITDIHHRPLCSDLQCAVRAVCN